MTKQNILFIISCLFLSGCTLGAPCDPDEYLDKDTKVCLKQTERNCGGQGSVDCLDNALYSQTNIKSWRCVDAKCQVDECLQNSERSEDMQSCDCKEGYYFDEEQNLCLKLSGNACGLNGEIDCYTQYPYPTVSKWRCETEGSKPECMIESCVPNSEMKQEQKTCECFPGYYYDSSLRVCLKMDVQHCGINPVNCEEQANDNPRPVSSWKCEGLNNNDYGCKPDKCIEHAHINEDSSACECDNEFEYNSKESTCTPKCIHKAEMCHANQYCDISDGCKVKSCVERCGEAKLCYLNECRNYKTQYNEETEETEIIRNKQPDLCKTDDALLLIDNHIDDYIDEIDIFNLYDEETKIAKQCELVRKFYRLFEEDEDAKAWCSSQPKCGSPKLLAQCHETMYEVVLNIMSGSGKNYPYKYDYNITYASRLMIVSDFENGCLDDIYQP